MGFRETIVAGTTLLLSACGIKPSETAVETPHHVDVASETTAAPQKNRDEQSTAPLQLSGHENDYVVAKTDGKPMLTLSTDVTDVDNNTLGSVTKSFSVAPHGAGDVVVFDKTADDFKIYSPDELKGGIRFVQGGTISAEALADLQPGDQIGSLPLPERIQAQLDALEKSREAVHEQLDADPRNSTYIDPETGKRVSPDERPFTERVQDAEKETGRSH